MIYFNSDYMEGAHPRILQRLAETNFEQTMGYSEDPHCERAASLVRKACASPDVAVHFLVGGTQSNLTVISAALRPHQSVISPQTGHISEHETGAIEAVGHKVNTLPTSDGKITAEQIDALVTAHWSDPSFEHIPQPKMVYLSYPTELGTIYSKAELEAISTICRKHDLILFVDGARLGYGLASPENDIDISFLAAHCDVFTIGGTKVGALFGEAIVIRNDALKKDFRYIIKQKGGMLAKGRLLGIQFECLFEDNLYAELSNHAISLAMQLKQGLTNLGIPFLIDSPTNQQFPILPNALIENLKDRYSFSQWKRMDNERTAVRICTSWATKEEAVTGLLQAIKTELARN
ncbi:MAG: low specificity L-threonine aldolase [Chloroflexi bacterium]|nr:low specificity L-threonine aldolase [Chloroflexota bacterium]